MRSYMSAYSSLIIPGISDLYSLPTILNLELAWSSSDALAVSKYVLLHLALYVGVLIVTVGLSDVELEKVEDPTAGYIPYEMVCAYVSVPDVL